MSQPPMEVAIDIPSGARILGGVLIKNDKMVLQVTGDKMRLIAMLTDAMQQGDMQLKSPLGDEQINMAYFTARHRRVKTSLDPLSAHITVYFNAEMTQKSKNKALTEDMLEQVLKQKLEEEVAEVVTYVAQTDTDFLRLGDVISNRFYSNHTWRAFEYPKRLQSLAITVEVRVEVAAFELERGE